VRVGFLVIVVWLALSAGGVYAQQFFKLDWNVSSGRSFQSKTFHSRELALDFADSLTSELKALGYLMVSREEVNQRDTILIRVESGTKFTWEKVGQGNVPDESWKKLGPPEKSYLGPYQWMDKLALAMEDKGYPFASIRIDSLKIQDSSLSGIFHLESGPLINWDSVFVYGTTKTRRQYLQLYSGIIPGKPFSQSQFESAIRRINRSPYFQLDSAAKLTFQIKSAIAGFKLRDRRINVFDGIIGLIPNQNQPNSMLVTGELNLELFHLGGKGRDIALHWQRPNVQSQNLELTARESYLFGSNLSVSVDFSLLKQDSSFVNRMIKLEFGYPISEVGGLRFFSRRQAGDLIGSFDSSEPLPDFLDFRWNNYGIGTNWDWLDDPLFPRRGANLEVEFSLGNKNLIENTALPEDAYQNFKRSSTQIRGFIHAEKHIYMNSIWGMWLRLRGGFLKNENLFLNELSRLGGLKSIRGFNEMYFFADRYALLNVEQRLFFGKGSYLMAFGDLGVINNPFILPRVDRPRSFGLGINLDTDGGLFSFVFGMGKSALQPISLSYARIHFGYLARF
jgi:outer membrane protein assembly factor BamA